MISKILNVFFFFVCYISLNSGWDQFAYRKWHVILPNPKPANLWHVFLQDLTARGANNFHLQNSLQVQNSFHFRMVLADSLDVSCGGTVQGEADHSPPSTAVKNKWNCAPTLSRAFMAWCKIATDFTLSCTSNCTAFQLLNLKHMYHKINAVYHGYSIQLGDLLS
jgi:hypothetical protein